MEFETFAEKFERRYYCNIFAAVGTAVAGAVASTAVNSIFGGGGSSGGGGGSSAPSYNAQPASVAVQTLPQQEDSKSAASAYDPTKDMQQWTSIFNTFGAKGSTNSDEMSLPSVENNTPNIQAGS